jgi:hypothetical protein
MFLQRKLRLVETGILEKSNNLYCLYEQEKRNCWFTDPTIIHSNCINSRQLFHNTNDVKVETNFIVYILLYNTILNWFSLTFQSLNIDFFRMLNIFPQNCTPLLVVYFYCTKNLYFSKAWFQKPTLFGLNFNGLLGYTVFYGR